MHKLRFGVIWLFVVITGILWVNITHAAGITIVNGDTVNIGDGAWNMTDGDMNNAGTLQASSGTISLGGNWSNSGTFDAGTGLVKFTGTTNQGVSGANTFYNLTCDSAGNQINFEAGKTQTITAALTLTGASGNLIKLRSTVDGSQWSINPQGTRNISYVDVKDSNNIGSAPIIPGNWTDSGNNTNWVNTPPVADAGAYQKIKVGQAITFNGSGSTDPDSIYGDTIVSYDWDVNGDGVYDLSGMNASYTYAASGEYTVMLRVTDSHGGTDTDTTIVTVNTPPSANAGADSSVYVTNSITLSGSGADADDDTLSYTWSLTPPAGSDATLTGADTLNPSFTADKAGTYLARLTVNDGLESASDEVTITTTNRAPVANAGDDQSAYINDTVALDGGGSTDADSNTLTYSWSITEQPENSIAALDNAASASPSFTPDKFGTYTVSLVVNDGELDSGEDTVTITTLNAGVTKFLINFGATTTTSRSIILNNTVKGGSPTHYMASESATFENAEWQAYAVMPLFTLSEESGVKTVYFKVKDANGELGMVSDTITLINNTWASFSKTFAVKSNGTLWAWGRRHDFLGNGISSEGQYSPVQVGLDTKWVSISTNNGSTFAVKSDGTLWAWGNNFSGQLGDGSYTDKHTPEQIGTDTNWVSVSTSGVNTFALKSDGTLWAWGYNEYGQLGDGTNTNKNTSVQIGTDTKWVSVSPGGNHTVAVKSDGTLWAWGAGFNCALGDGTGAHYNVPLQIGTDNTWIFVSAGGVHTVAIKSDGTLWAWGSNFYGQLGNGGTNNDCVPVQVGTGTNWVTVSTTDHTVGVKSDGTLWAWGNNEYGQLGDGTNTGKYAPVSIGTDTQWISVSAGYSHTLALKSDGTLWAWGENGGGLGDGTWEDKNVPVQTAYFTVTPQAVENGSISPATVQKVDPGESLACTITPDAGYAVTDVTVDDASVGAVTTYTFDYVVSNHTISATFVALPVVSTFQINNGAADTTSRTVTLDNTAEGSPMHYMASESSGFTGAAWQDYSASPAFTLSAGYEAKTVYFKVKNSNGESETVSDSITLLNTVPVADAVNVTTNEDVATSVTLSGSDADGDALTFSVLTQPAHGTLSGAAPNLTYTPATNYAGSDSFTYQVNDGTADSVAATVAITVMAVNDAPAANAVSVMTNEDEAASVTLSGSDVEGDALTFSVLTQPTHGTLSGTAPNLTYTPATNYAGSDNFTYRVSDGALYSDAATVMITVSSVNDAPVANAGAAPTVYVGDTAALDGSGSSDQDGDAITYSWTMSSRPENSSAELLNATSAYPTFKADAAGTYELVLTVSDGTLSSTATLVITTTNSVPVANAGADQTPYVTQTVALNGSGSTDADGDLLTFTWEFTSKPDGSGATLDDAHAVSPTFYVDRPGDYKLSLTVNDGTEDSEPDTVIISTQNSAPVANAGSDQSPHVQETVTLNGEGSTDADGNLLTYTWEFTSQPDGSGATLDDVHAVKPTFYVDKPGDYKLSLTVNDGTEDSEPDTVIISTQNSAPVANAGSDQSPHVQETVTLNGEGSTDVDGDQLTFTWAFTSKPEGSNATLSDTSAVAPTFYVDRPGDYVVSLTVSDGTLNSEPSTVMISTRNSAPVADAGDDQSVYVHNTVTLDGSGSIDVDGNQLTYTWALTTRPEGSSATLSNANAVAPTFDVDKPGDYVVSLKVNDGEYDSAPDTVMISTLNTAPVADAGQDQLVTVIGSTVSLDGTQSYDLEGDTIAYQWSFVSRPGGSAASLTDADTATPSFAADVRGDYVIQLIASDASLQSDPDNVTVSFDNLRPVADAGTSQSVVVGNTVSLDGSGSTDANGDTLTYQWTLVTVPDGGQYTITNSTDAAASFVPDVVGTYVAQLVVNDGDLDSDPDTIQIEVVTGQTMATTVVQDSQAVVVSLDTGAFQNSNQQNTLQNKLNSAIASIEAGNYADAKSQLESIQKKTDGCATSGAPDKNDWIDNCEDQSTLYQAIQDAIAAVDALMQ